MQYKIATLDDIEATLKLHAKYQIDSIKEEDKKDGFVTTAFTKEELTQLITQEQGLFIAKEGDEVLAYVISASWEFWSKWAMFRHMITDLPKLEYKGMRLSTQNSYQYGPICIDKRVRGTEVLPTIFDFALKEMSKRYPILITFVNQINPRSYEAHHRKLGLDIIQEFEFNGNRYWEIGCMSSRVVNNDNLKIREANKEDVNAILFVVNRAYRSNNGWTNESSLVSGDRVEVSEIINYLENSKSHLFVLTIKDRVEACICIEELNGQAYIGFFAVNPNLQGQGIGKKLLTFAEDFASKSLNLTYFKMAVLADRGELIDFYLRRGYQKTEQTTAYPKDLNVGTPKREDLIVIYLEKEV